MPALDGSETIRVFHKGTPLDVGVEEVGKKINRQLLVSALRGKVGATAGWVITGATDKSHATLPASQTGSTLVIPIWGLEVGDTITAFHLVGQIESAGGAVTLDADLRSETVAAADNVDASVGAITQIAVSADTALSATQGKSGLSAVVAVDKTYYLLVTGTTAASTDIDLLGVVLTITKG